MPAVDSPELEGLAAAWRAASDEAAGGLPTLDSLARHGVPLDHPGHGLLALVPHQAADRRAGPGFRFISAGSDHQALGGHTMTGHLLDEIAHPAHLARIVKLYTDILAAGEPHDWRCINMARNAPPSRYRRVLAPIADDVGDGRCLFGIWVWDQGVLLPDRHQTAA